MMLLLDIYDENPETKDLMAKLDPLFWQRINISVSLNDILRNTTHG
jgi:hypothetical protein